MHDVYHIIIHIIYIYICIILCVCVCVCVCVCMYIITIIYFVRFRIMLMWEAGNNQTRTAQTPTVFFSGALHGDERVGTTATTGFFFLNLKSQCPGIFIT